MVRLPAPNVSPHCPSAEATGALIAVRDVPLRRSTNGNRSVSVVAKDDIVLGTATITSLPDVRVMTSSPSVPTPPGVAGCPMYVGRSASAVSPANKSTILSA